TPARFEEKAKAAEFFEHATVFEQRYGTPKQPVLSALGRGRDVLFDIDWQGTQQLKEQAREDLVSVFLLPPSHDELERRLKARAQISHWPEYDYVIVNRDLDRALAQITAILEAERARRTRLVGVGEFVAELMR